MLKKLMGATNGAGILKLEVNADDLMKVMKDVIAETTNSLIAKFYEERNPEFIPRKEAMKKLNVKTSLTMQRWEEQGYLIPHRIGGRIFYRQDELATAAEKFSRTDDVQHDKDGGLN
jgi:hypothetical protein